MCDELATIYLSKRFYLFLLHLEFSPIVLHLLPCMITVKESSTHQRNHHIPRHVVSSASAPP